MKVSGRWSVAVAVLMMICVFHVRRLAAQAEYQPHGFIASRYDTHTSSNIFFGYTLGPVTPMAALVSNPRSGYREHLLGLVRFETFSPHLGLTWAVAGAKAIDSWYAQVYALPSIKVGRVEYAATFEQYIPLETAGVRQIGMNPGNIFVTLNGRFRVGAVGVWANQSNAPYNLGAGPSAQIRFPKGSITLDEVIGVTRWTSEFRVSFFTSY